MKTEASDKAEADARYQAKLTAWATGAVQVTVTPAPPPSETATDPDSVHARYQAKLKLAKKGAPEAVAKAAPAAPVEVKPDAEAESAAALTTESDPSSSYRPQQSGRRRG